MLPWCVAEIGCQVHQLQPGFETGSTAGSTAGSGNIKSACSITIHAQAKDLQVWSEDAPDQLTLSRRFANARVMSGLRRVGEDANPFGSKFKDSCGGFDAGNGQRTYTKPSYTLFVTGIPDAESSDSVEEVFAHDKGFLQCRPVGHKSRRMVFVDYDAIDHATSAMRMHQGFKWEDVDEGLRIDYDQDARSKRNTALDQGIYDKFYPIAARKPVAESESEWFARLREQSGTSSGTAPKTSLTVRKAALKHSKDAKNCSARIQVRARNDKADSCSSAEGAQNERVAENSAEASFASLVGYESDSDDV